MILKEGSHLRRLQPQSLTRPKPHSPSILKEGSHLRRLQPHASASRHSRVRCPQRRQPSTTAATAPVSYIVYDAVPAPCCERCLVSLESECIPLSLFPGRPCDISRQARP